MIIKLVFAESSTTYDLTDEQVSALKCISVHGAYRVTPRRLADSLVSAGLLRAQPPVKLGLCVFTQRGRDVWAEVVKQRKAAEKAAGERQ